ncbi:MAG: hypothetical protein J5714_04830 [Alphaproteobacteria bacterium]|nr:hypothetical protein [Alphaproteobacteria bacterium]
MFENLNQYFLITMQIWVQRRFVRNIRNKKLDKFEMIAAVPVNRDRKAVIDQEKRSHCVIIDLCYGKPDDICSKYKEMEHCGDSRCVCADANKAYIMQKQKFANAEKEYNRLLESRRVIRRKLWTRNK